MGQSGKLIFMVDDDKVILNLLEYVFQGKNDYRIKTFVSGENCLENMHLKPDLVVLDYVLSGSDKNAMNGLETLKKLIKKSRDLPVIILSGNTDDKTSEEMIRHGARKVLRKNDYFIDKLEKYIATEIR